MIETVLAIIMGVMAVVMAVLGIKKRAAKPRWEPVEAPKDYLEEIEKEASDALEKIQEKIDKPSDDYDDAVERIIREGRRRAKATGVTGANVPNRANKKRDR